LTLLLLLPLACSGSGGGGETAGIGAITLVPASLGEGREGWPFWERLQARGGQGPYAYRIVGGALAPGLALDGATGEIAGIPAAAGTYDCRIRVTDTADPTRWTEAAIGHRVAGPWSAADPQLERYNLFFIHHSVGQNLWLRGPLALTLYQHNYWPTDMTYREGNVGGYVIGDHTDVPDWPVNFNTPDYFQTMYTWELQAGEHHQVVLFKSCFPNSQIASEQLLGEFKAAYRILLATFRDHPQTLFVPFSPPPLNPASTTRENAARARRLADWLKFEYSAQEPNVIAFDLFDALANPPDHPTEPDMLRADYRIGTDSHPNEAADKAVTPRILAFLNAALRAAGLEP
jgi:hypothetical protein